MIAENNDIYPREDRIHDNEANIIVELPFLIIPQKAKGFNGEQAAHVTKS